MNFCGKIFCTLDDVWKNFIRHDVRRKYLVCSIFVQNNAYKNILMPTFFPDYVIEVPNVSPAGSQCDKQQSTSVVQSWHVEAQHSMWRPLCTNHLLAYHLILSLCHLQYVLTFEWPSNLTLGTKWGNLWCVRSLECVDSFIETIFK